MNRLVLVTLLFLISLHVYAQGQWTTPVSIDTSRYPYALGGSMALDDSDNIYATFSSRDGGTFFVVHSKDGGNTWMQYPYSGSEQSRVPRDIVVDHLGNVWLLWISWQDEFAPAYLNLSKSIDSGKTFATMFRSISYADGQVYQKLAVDSQNSIYMLWDDHQFKVTRFIHGDTLRRVDAVIPRDTFQIGSYPVIAVSRDFVVHCVWEGADFDSANDYHEYVFYSRSNDTGATFLSGTRVDTTTNHIQYHDVDHYPSLSIDTAGSIFVSYTRELGINYREIRFTSSKDGGELFDPPNEISGTDTVYESELCIDSKGGINCLWSAAYHGERHFRSTNAGTSFSLFANIPIALIQVKAAKNGFLFAITGNDSGMAFTKTNIVLSVSEDSYKPNTYSLFQNYPNPFNPSTSIVYSLPQSAHVRLVVYNVLGQEVATLVNGTQNAGYHTEKFEAGKLSSGVYMYRITAHQTEGGFATGTFTDSKKMVLIK